MSRIPPQAFRHALAAYEAGRSEEAERGCRAILDAAPGDCDALHLLGLAQFRGGRWLAALASYDGAMAASPANAALLNNRGNLLRALRRLPEALASYDRALAIRPDYPEAFNNRGVVLNDLGRGDEALASYDRALALRPHDAEPHNNRGIALKQRRRFAQALASFDRALAVRPDHAEALNNRGNVLYELRRFEAALASYDRLLAFMPLNADALNHRGNALRALRRFDEALASYDRALAIRPDHASAHCNRGLTLAETYRFDAALASFERALAVAPDHADALTERGNALKQVMRLGEAAASYRRALDLDPDREFAFTGLAECALKLCDWALQDELSGEVRRRAIEGRIPVAPLVLFGYSDDEAVHLAGARRYAARRFAVAPQPLWSGAAWRNERIKLAYLSADFRQHPVAQLAAGLLERHDRSRFETIGISFGPDDGSGLRARLIAGCDRFLDVSTVGDRDVAKLLSDMRCDIAIDLAGYTWGCRPEILSCRPAPIAVGFLGYPGTMAVDFIDYIIADDVVVPPESEPFYAEKVVRLPHSFMPGNPPGALPLAAPAPAAARAEAGLPPHGIVFCCFNNHAKIAAPVFGVWMRLLRDLNGSVLWLSAASDEVVRNLKQGAATRGVDPARLVFAPRAERFADHLARHRLADLFLDTLPYNAHTTANDALSAGLPVLTCRGGSLPGRVAASLVRAAGLAELVTSTLEEYEAAALRLARDPAALTTMKARLRNRATKPLFEADRFCRHLETAYVTMWERWQRGEAPEGFAVAPCPETVMQMRRDAPGAGAPGADAPGGQGPSNCHG